jgi:hypothetical protein
MSDAPKVEFLSGELARLDLQPGDTAVLMLDRPLSMEQVADLHRVWEAAFIGPAPKLLVLDAGTRLGVLRAAPEGGA